MNPARGEDLDRLLRERLGPIDRTWRPRGVPVEGIAEPASPDLGRALRDAAVLAPLFHRDGEDWLLLTKRREGLPDHPGQVAFPGGAREGEEDPVACALRETSEEIGIAPATVELLGRLPDRVSIAGFLVAAFVGRIPAPAGLRVDVREVERLLVVPVRRLLDEDRWRYEDRRSSLGVFRRVPFFDWHGPTIWGLTGMFVRDLVAVAGETTSHPPPPPPGA
jgi:8-oxo-dGTP pyrophosphatase MutT (NUDIX family)